MATQPSERVRVRNPRYCSVCGKTGHDKRKCPKHPKPAEEKETPYRPAPPLQVFYSVENHIMEIARLASKVREQRQIGDTKWAMKFIEAAIEEARLLTELLGGGKDSPSQLGFPPSNSHEFVSQRDQTGGAK